MQQLTDTNDEAVKDLSILSCSTEPNKFSIDSHENLWSCFEILLHLSSSYTKLITINMLFFSSIWNSKSFANKIFKDITKDTLKI